MKRFILLAALAVMLSTAQAEIRKKVLYVDYFTSGRTTAQYEDAIRNRVITGIENTNRLNVIDVNTQASLALEAERRMSEAAMSDYTSRVGQMKTMGANYILSGNVDNITIEEKRTESGTRYYNAQLIFTLKILDVENGALHGTKTFTNNGGGIMSGSTPQKAIETAISLIGSKMEILVDEHFSLKGTIAEMKEAKKKKMVSCYINLGTGHGVSKGQYVKVSKISEIAGRETIVEIGRLKVEVDIAEDLSECKVIKGGDEIYQAFANGDDLVVETIKQGGFMGGLNSLSY